MYVAQNGSLEMKKSATIYSNHATTSGGGIYAASGITLEGAVDGVNVYGNFPDNIYVKQP